MNRSLDLTIQLPAVIGAAAMQQVRVIRNPAGELPGDDTFDLDLDVTELHLAAEEGQHVTVELTAFDAAGHASKPRRLQVQARENHLAYIDEMHVSSVKPADTAAEPAGNTDDDVVPRCRVCGTAEADFTTGGDPDNDTVTWVVPIADLEDGEKPICTACAGTIDGMAEADGISKAAAEVAVIADIALEADQQIP